MSIVYTSKINSLVINPTYTDASGNAYPYTILKVNWVYTATQNGFSYSIHPQTILEKPMNSEFVHYDSLTETEILNWVFSTDVWIESYQRYLKDKMDELAENVITVTSFHWEKETGTTGITEQTGATGVTGQTGTIQGPTGIKILAG